jgi:hypothetical protein
MSAAGVAAALAAGVIVGMCACNELMVSVLFVCCPETAWRVHAGTKQQQQWPNAYALPAFHQQRCPMSLMHDAKQTATANTAALPLSLSLSNYALTRTWVTLSFFVL